MKAMNRFFAGTTLAITLMGAGAAWGDPSVVGGNVIVDRLQVDTANNFYLVDTNHPLNADGTLDQWEIFAETTAPVRLVIYRQKGDKFFVVDRSERKNPKQGYNLFNLRPKIKVKAGDFVGAYHPNRGSISFSFDPPFFNQSDLTGTTLFSFDGKATRFSLSSNRHYSIRVMGGQSQQNCQTSITSVNAQPNVLWPPNKRMVPVTVAVSASNSCDTTLVCKIISVSSNEPESSSDWKITGDLTVNLRAERAGNGTGRVYTLTVECKDQSGNSATKNATVTVPHNQ